MSQEQEIFNMAVKSYDEAVVLIKNVGEAIRKMQSMSGEAPTFNPGITLSEFDEILQGILLTQAIADNDFDVIERQFVDKITIHGNLLDYIRFASDGKLSLTWDTIAWSDSEAQMQLVEILPQVLETRCQDFIEPFLLVEALSEEFDFMNEIVEHIAMIGACLANIDGKVDEIEAQGASVMVKTLLLDRWEQMKQSLSES